VGTALPARGGQCRSPQGSTAFGFHPLSHLFCQIDVFQSNCLIPAGGEGRQEGPHPVETGASVEVTNRRSLCLPSADLLSNPSDRVK